MGWDFGWFSMGGDFGGTGGRSSQNLRGTAHGSVPQIFGEVVIRDVWEVTEKNETKKFWVVQ